MTAPSMVTSVRATSSPATSTASAAISLRASRSIVAITGNFIGVDATGMAALANRNYGIFLPASNDGQSSITIGGTAAGSGNVISANINVGVYVTNANVVVQGNRIGTDLAGNLNLGNGNHGVELTRAGSAPFPSVQFTIGGATQGAGNIISANGGYGIRFFNIAGAVTVQGNLIGTKADGAAELGNRFNGIRAESAATAIAGNTSRLTIPAPASSECRVAES